MAENVTEKLFFGSLILRLRQRHGTGNYRKHELLGLGNTYVCMHQPSVDDVLLL